MTDLVSQNGNGTGGGHLVLPKPQGRKSGWNPQDKSGCCWGQNLTEESDKEPARVGRAGLDPGPDSVAGGAHYQGLSQALFFHHPHNGHDEDDVGEEVHHWQPVNRHAGGVVEAHKDVVYAAVLNPHEAVAHGVQAEDDERDPSVLVQLGFHLETGLRGIHSESFRPMVVFSSTGILCLWRIVIVVYATAGEFIIRTNAPPTEISILPPAFEALNKETKRTTKERTKVCCHFTPSLSYPCVSHQPDDTDTWSLWKCE